MALLPSEQDRLTQCAPAHGASQCFPYVRQRPALGGEVLALPGPDVKGTDPLNLIDSLCHTKDGQVVQEHQDAEPRKVEFAASMVSLPRCGHPTAP